MAEPAFGLPSDAQPTRDRDAFADTGRALRESIDRAIELGGTQVTRSSRVLLAAYWILASYSRISDRVFVGQIARLASINGDIDERHTRRALKFWHDRDALWWEPAETGRGNGYGRASTLSLRPPDTQAPLLNVVVQRGPHVDERPGHIWTPNPATSGRPTEEFSRGTRTEETFPPEQVEARYAAHVAALVDTSLDSGQTSASLRSPRRSSSVERLLEVLPADEIESNTRAVLEGKFDQLPSHWVEKAREELLEAGAKGWIRKTRIAYLNGIADRMLKQQVRRRSSPA